jgi:hypothetical protein
MKLYLKICVCLADLNQIQRRAAAARKGSDATE